MLVDKASKQTRYSRDRHPLWTLLVAVLVLAGAALTGAAFWLSSYITTTRLAPFFDDQLVQDVGGADAFTRQEWRVETRVGALEICYTIQSPAQWAAPERCFHYHSDSFVATRGHGQKLPFPSACGILRAHHTTEMELWKLLDSVCGFPGFVIASLPVVTGVVAILTAAVAACTLFAPRQDAQCCHKLALVGATLNAVLVLVVYVAWMSVVSAGLDMHQAVSAQLTGASLVTFVVAAVVALALVRVENENQGTQQPAETVVGDALAA